MPLKDLLTWIGVSVAAIGSVRYLISMFRGQTRPHAFSYMLWAIAETAIFAIQLLGHAGIGAWITGWNAFACWVIALLAFRYGDRLFSKMDWMSLGASILALVLWALTQNPLLAVLFLILSDAISYSITFRKAYAKPYSETLFSYFMSWCKSIIALFALQNYAVSNWLFLAYLITFNGSFLLMVLLRRQQIKA